jgi:hypothetical protein
MIETLDIGHDQFGKDEKLFYGLILLILILPFDCE